MDWFQTYLQEAAFSVFTGLGLENLKASSTSDDCEGISGGVEDIISLFDYDNYGQKVLEATKDVPLENFMDADMLDHGAIAEGDNRTLIKALLWETLSEYIDDNFDKLKEEFSK